MERLHNILKTIKPGVDFINTADLVNEGILDSLDIVAIISSITKKFDVELRPEDIDPNNFQSIDHMWKMIQKLKQN